MSSFSLRDAPPPSAAVEIAADRVAAALLEVRGGRPVVAAHHIEGVPAGTLAPSLTAANVRDRDALAAAVHRVLDAVGRPRRVGLLIPDPVAKVSLLRFAEVPARPADLDQLVRWQVRKAAPFPIDEAQVSYARAGLTAEGHGFLVTVARRAAIEEYESLCAAAGAHAGLVDLSTLNVINAAIAGAAPPPAGDWLLVSVAPDHVSIAVLRGADVIFFRTRSAEDEGTLADLVHQTAMYYEDRLAGAGFSRVLLAGATAAGAQEVADQIALRLGTAVDALDPFAAAPLTDRIGPSPALADALTPIVGLLLRGQKVAA
jgi:Tfp pilus assembly PilM family ATPase